LNPISPTTPLVALDVLAVDTETTGLDPATARIVQLAAIPLQGVKLTDASPTEWFINPAIPIPPSATAIHRITDFMVAKAPAFSGVWPAFAEWRGHRVIVGYRAGFDVAVLKSECARASIAWEDPPRLCVRALAVFVKPGLADTTLEGLCRWLGITITGRHSAAGDAMAAAEIWARLVPMLVQKGIRTLGEAAAAAVQGESGDQASMSIFAKAVEPDILVPGTSNVPVRLDSYAYSHRARDVMSTPPVFAPSTTSVREAVRVMTEKGISSVLIDERNGAAGGIVTERDLLRGLARGGNVDTTTIGELASRPLLTIPTDMHLYKAVGRMNRLGIRHLAVTSTDGSIVGMVTPRNLLRERATEAIVLGDEIEAADDGTALATARAKLVTLAMSLLADGMEARGICAVISAELCALTKRAAELAEQQMLAEGKGAAPVPYAVLVLGSGGRGESLLAPDQDNAIVYERGEAGGVEDAWFAELGARIADTLDVAGIPYCKGGIMARNPEWRKSVSEWHGTVDGWVRRSRPEDLLNVDIFFDAVPVYGESRLGEEIWAHAYNAGKTSPVFQRLLAELARNWRSPLGLFGGFRADRGNRTDLKIGGLMPIFTSARVLSIKHGVPTRSTPERLRGLADVGVLSGETVETVLAAHETILREILQQQLSDSHAGIPPTNLVDTASLPSRKRAKLRQAVKAIPQLTEEVAEGLL
jgi:CBS domain-containing protein